jgi:hypothetical protein
LGQMTHEKWKNDGYGWLVRVMSFRQFWCYLTWSNWPTTAEVAILGYFCVWVLTYT